MIGVALLLAATIGAPGATIARLDNGMTVLVSPDPHVSDAAIELWFRAGSSDERSGQHGIAHLFEHMLPGAEHVLGNPDNATAQRRDSLDSNGSTGTDYTNFFMRVPGGSVELAIALYADRMSAAPESITEESLARNRTIVLSEFRNSAGRSWDPALTDPMRQALFGSTDPYGHAVLGTTIEVGAIKVEDMRQWFRMHYGAANAMLIVAGNVDPDYVIALAKKHFGSIPPGAAHPLALPPIEPSRRRQTIALNVPQAKPSTVIAWRTPRWSDAERQDVSIAIESFRIHLRTKLRCDVNSGDAFTGSAAGEWSLSVSCGTPSVIFRELDAFLATTPDIATERDARRAEFAESLDRLGWRGSRTQLLGEGLWFGGSATAYEQQLARLETTTPAAVMRAANRWLRNPLLVEVRPALVDSASDRGAALTIPRPQPPAAAEVLDEDIGDARVLVAPRNLAFVIGRVAGPNGIESFISAPSRALARLDEALRGKSRRDLALVLVGDFDRERVARALRELPPGEAATSEAPPARFTAKPGATQTTIHATLQFVTADPARIAIAADLLRSRLNSRIRETEHWSYGINVRTDRQRIAIDAPVDDEVAVKAIAVIRGAIEGLPHQPLSAADATRLQGAELRRLEKLASTASDLADALISVIESGESYASYVRHHRELYNSLQEGALIELPEPEVTWSISGDPAHVDPPLQK
jgi:predicted Zn-dependent peptidase